MNCFFSEFLIAHCNVLVSGSIFPEVRVCPPFFENETRFRGFYSKVEYAQNCVCLLDIDQLIKAVLLKI